MDRNQAKQEEVFGVSFRHRLHPPSSVSKGPDMGSYQKAFGFGFRAFKKFPELIPLATILTTACVGAASFIVYSLATKPDVRVVKSSELPPWERVLPTEPRKMRVVDWNLYKPNPELEKLRQEIGSYKP